MDDEILHEVTLNGVEVHFYRDGSVELVSAGDIITVHGDDISILFGEWTDVQIELAESQVEELQELRDNILNAL